MMILLIIEDDTLFAELVQLAINAPSVMVAGTIRQGFAMMELQRPDFIVLDLSLPDSNPKDTIQLIPKLKEQSGGARVTVVTGNDDPKLERAARLCGADHYMAKDPGDALVRGLAESHRNVQPCANRDTVEAIEKKVAQMTGTTDPFPRPDVPPDVVKKVVPLLTNDENGEKKP